MLESICALMMLFSGDASTTSSEKSYNDHLVSCLKEHVKTEAQNNGHYFNEKIKSFIIPVEGVTLRAQSQAGFAVIDENGYARFLAIAKNRQGKPYFFTIQNKSTGGVINLQVCYKCDGHDGIQFTEQNPQDGKAYWNRTIYANDEAQARAKALAENKIGKQLDSLYKQNEKISEDCHKLKIMDTVRRNNPDIQRTETQQLQQQ